MTRRDIVVIGASAGGLDAVTRILGQLPGDLPASIVVVQHLPPDAGASLASLLDRRSRLPVRWIEQGAALEHAHVYLAPPNLHAIFIDDHLQLLAGADEDHARPSIDRLMLSAAALHGSRTIGVLLTGMLDDGVAGMRALEQGGGYTIVQAPETAEFPELPRRALLSLRPDRVLAIDAIGASLVEIAREDPVPPSVTCPECNRTVWDGDTEAALWSAIRALDERAIACEELAGDALRAGNALRHQLYLARATTARTQADTARAFVLATPRRSAARR